MRLLAIIFAITAGLPSPPPTPASPTPPPWPTRAAYLADCTTVVTAAYTHNGYVMVDSITARHCDVAYDAEILMRCNAECWPSPSRPSATFGGHKACVLACMRGHNITIDSNATAIDTDGGAD